MAFLLPLDIKSLERSKQTNPPLSSVEKTCCFLLLLCLCCCCFCFFVVGVVVAFVVSDVFLFFVLLFCCCCCCSRGFTCENNNNNCWLRGKVATTYNNRRIVSWFEAYHCRILNWCHDYTPSDRTVWTLNRLNTYKRPGLVVMVEEDSQSRGPWFDQIWKDWLSDVKSTCSLQRCLLIWFDKI